MDLLVGLGDRVSHADDPVTQPQPRLLCRVYRTGGGVHLGKAHDKCPLREHLHPKGRAAYRDRGALHHGGADGLDRQPAAQCQRGLIAARCPGAGHIAAAVPAQRLHPAKARQRERLFRFQIDFLRQGAPQPAQRRHGGHQQINPYHLYPPDNAVLGHFTASLRIFRG